MIHTRRSVLIASASAALTAFFGVNRVFAQTEDFASAIEEFTAGAEVNEGVIKLTTPEIAENGNSVPVSVLVESPMTKHDYVEAVALFAEGNPFPEVATFNFSPLSGEAMVSTRMRLAQTQNVVALARLSNGDFYKASNSVKVTIGGCGA